MKTPEKYLKTLDKHYAKKVVNRILGKRYCSKCAEKAWKGEDNDQTVIVHLGICSKCGKGGIVAYIDY